MKKTWLPKVAWALAILVVLAIVSGLTFGKKWVRLNSERLHVERTISTELKPLESTLSAFGFKDLTNLATSCEYVTYNTDPNSLDDTFHDNGTYLDCASGIDRFLVIPSSTAGKTAFNQHAQELSKVLQTNGWKSRPDYLTIPWFQKISEGVDYQPDQLNTKTIGDLECTVDFFTAFSKPSAPALSLHAFCVKNEKA